jgi:hypothetical protein
MDLILFGDSFPAGVRRAKDRARVLTVKDEIRESFGSQLKQMGVVDNFILYAKGGNPNIAISYDVFKNIKKHKKNSIVLVCWSGILRQGVWDSYNKRFKTPKEKLEDSREYQKIVWENSCYINATTNFLIDNNIKFLYTSSFSPYNQGDLKKYLSDSTKLNWIEYYSPNNSLFNIISENWLIGHPVEGIFDEHVNLNKTSKLIFECMHPNKEGHIEIAKVLKKYILDLIKDKEYVI